MDAERLIGVSRHALAGSTDEWDVIAEAWQAQSLARAIGVQLALNGPKELESDARELAEGAGATADHRTDRPTGCRGYRTVRGRASPGYGRDSFPGWPTSGRP